jgi:hypothetical protein
MSYGRTELHTLLSQASVTALLSDGADSIWYDHVLPDEVTGPQESTINYYRIDPVDAGAGFMRTSYSINCRAASMAAAEDISRAVLGVVNRHTNGSVYFVTSILPVIPPIDLTDNYNSPVEVIAKGRTI